jgi:hypothetical protein
MRVRRIGSLFCTGLTLADEPTALIAHGGLCEGVS